MKPLIGWLVLIAAAGIGSYSASVLMQWRSGGYFLIFASWAFVVWGIGRGKGWIEGVIQPTLIWFGLMFVIVLAGMAVGQLIDWL